MFWEAEMNGSEASELGWKGRKGGGVEVTERGD